MIEVEVDDRGRVATRYSQIVPVDRATAWRTLADLERVICLDHFHRAADFGDRPPAPGLEFALPHRFLGFGPDRHGRILRYTEGRGYAWSDLSRRGPRAGFPHVFTIDLHPEPPVADRPRTRLDLGCRGLWTAPLLPRPVVELWLLWNVWSIGVRVVNAILLDAWRGRNHAKKLR